VITYEQLHNQNHRITELSNILLYLFKDRSLCDTSTCCELFQRYMQQVKEHIDLVDKNLYGELLQNDDNYIRNTARNFMSGSQEIRRIMTQYVRNWCPTMHADALAIAQHDRFLADTEKMFELILQRIQDETERLYPLIRQLSGNAQYAA